jgi:hypothetical protein
MNNDKSARLAGTSTDKTSSDASPARGLGGRQRTSTFDMSVSHAAQHDANLPEGTTIRVHIDPVDNCH